VKKNPPKSDAKKHVARLSIDGDLLVLLEWSHEGALLVDCLEATVTLLGGGIDELELDGLESSSGGLLEERLSEGDGSLLGSADTALDHDEVRLDKTVLNKATNGVDALVGDIGFGGSVVLDLLAVDGVEAGTDSVDLLVDLGSVMVTLLTRSGNGEGDSRWMPGTNTGDLSETLVSLSGELLGVPSASDTMVTSTLGDTDNIDHLSLVEDGVDGDLLFEVVGGPVDLVGDAVSTIDLDFDDVSLLLSKRKTLHLGVADSSDGLSVLLDHGDISLDGLLAILGLPSLGSLGEGLLLGVVPASVESSLGFVRDVVGPDGLDGSWSVGGLDVTGKTDDLEWWGLDDGNGFDDLLLVDGRAWLLSLSDDVSHTGLEAHEGSKVNWLGSIILWEGLDLTTWPGASLFRQELKGTVSWCGELTMGHDC